MGSLFQELKRRKVFRVAAVYAVVAWLLIQVSDVVLPTFGAPDWVNQTLIFLFIVGFPVAVILSWAYDVTPEGIKPETQAGTYREVRAASVQPINYLILLIVLLVAGFQVTDRFLSSTNSPAPRIVVDAFNSAGQQSFRSELNLGSIERRPGDQGFFTITLDFSTDGSKLLYTSYKDGQHRIHVRDLKELDAQIIVESPGSLGFPWASPDGQWVAYRGGADLYIVPLSGGTSRLIASGIGINTHRWLDAETLLYRQGGGEWYRYSQLTRESALLPSSRETVGLRDPHALPGSDFVLFTNSQNQGSTNTWIEAYNFSTGERQILINNAFAARYVNSGHLLFMRDSDLWAVLFDVENLQASGIERPVVRGIENEFRFGSHSAYAVSRDGLLIYLPGEDVSAVGDKLLTWVDREGSEEVLTLPQRNYSDPVISQDGLRLAVTVTEPDGIKNVWVHNFNQPGILNRVTQSGVAENAVWTPDGRDLIFAQESENSLWRINGSGVGNAELLMTSDATIAARSFTPDGDLLIDYNWFLNSDTHRISQLDTEIPQQRLLTGEFHERMPSVSPDGKLLAYVSHETGRAEIYLRPYPDVDGNKWRISANGGNYPQWSTQSNLLHYLTPDNRFVSVEVQAEPAFLVGQQEEISLHNFFLNNAPAYGVAPEGDRFLFMKFPTNEASLDALQRSGQQPVLAVVVHNWFNELRELVPTEVR